MSEDEAAIITASTEALEGTSDAQIAHITRWQRRRRRWASLVWLVVGLGLLLQLIARDGWGIPWNALFYMLPRPILCVMTCLAVLLTAKPNRRWGWIVFGSLLIWLVTVDIGWQPVVAREENSLRVVVWNVAHLFRGREAVTEFAKTLDADLIGLLETRGVKPEHLAEWERLMPGYTAHSTRYGMIWMAKRSVTIQPSVELAPNSGCMAMEFDYDGQPCRAVLVDIASSLKVPRVPTLSKCHETIKSWDQRPTLILGDFNTPPESRGFDLFREDFRNAFSDHGRGYAATWPVPCPVLQLDMIWVSSEWDIRQCYHDWSDCSDHRPVVMDVIFRTN
ncbi:hypothetical protein GC163_20895 [bacterium]|nr:hypothetical protein [bacterium]